MIGVPLGHTDVLVVPRPSRELSHGQVLGGTAFDRGSESLVFHVVCGSDLLTVVRELSFAGRESRRSADRTVGDSLGPRPGDTG